MGKALRWANELLAFLLELAALATLGYWGFTVEVSLPLKVVLGIGSPVLAAVVWGLLAAPRARFQLPVAGVLAVKAAVFAAATLALCVVAPQPLAIGFAALVALNTAAVTITRAKLGTP
ncbi:Protein of unknown function (DUF2568) [Saccharomonospora marina XMU15]|uniref:DUF2568 domain-containing protein n=1 Tax=Saccharomonospora marina XMU15 TaxID=882083 RepID=H5X992_9PSEU|nr:YrdB family protein [Saccharomonospora marina]EHR49194.1 Protein of unknown function (DUF2568) [Saccharomonospora marina XMU15]